MCGICGIYSPTLTLEEKLLFRNLLVHNVIRGEDSTGVISAHAVHKEKLAIKSFKTTRSSPVYAYSKHFERFTQLPLSLLVGHTRAATKGAVVTNNAHPFAFDNIIGVHNGTIPGKFKFSTRYVTDSEAIYKNISVIGIEKTIRMLSDGPGAYVLVWVDNRDGSINFIRNSKRPLYLTYLFAGQTLVWSSTKETLQYALNEKNIQSAGHLNSNTGQRTQKLFTLEPHHHMKIIIGQAPTASKITNLDIKEYVMPPVAYNTFYNNVRTNSGNNYGTATTNSGYNYNDYSQNGQEFQPWQEHLPSPRKPGSTTKGKYKKHPGVYSKRPDGEYRTDAEEFRRVNAPYNDAHNEGDLSDIPWVNSYISNETVIPTGAEKILQDGCVCCGEVPETPEIAYWNGEIFACEICYEDPANLWIHDIISGKSVCKQALLN